MSRLCHSMTSKVFQLIVFKTPYPRVPSQYTSITTEDGWRPPFYLRILKWGRGTRQDPFLVALPTHRVLTFPVVCI